MCVQVGAHVVTILFTNTRNALNFLGGHVISHEFPTGTSNGTDAPVKIVSPCISTKRLIHFNVFPVNIIFRQVQTIGSKMKLPYMVKYKSVST